MRTTAVVVCAVLSSALLGQALADTFTEKTTGQVIHAKLLGKATKDGADVLVAKTADGKQRLLNATDWTVEQDRTPARPPQPKPEPIYSTPSVTEATPETAAETAGKSIRPARKGVAVVRPDRSTLHPWDSDVQGTDRADSLQSAKYLLVIGRPQRTAMGIQRYYAGGRSAPSITRYQYDLDVRLVRANSNTTIASRHFRNPAPPFPLSAPYSPTEVGDPVSSSDVMSWLAVGLAKLETGR